MESYSHIELTEDELNEAIFFAKRKKEAIIEQSKVIQKIEESRKTLTESQWSVKQTRAYMIYRASNIFEGKFKLDEYNEPIFNLLCHYFSNDNGFISLATNMGIDNPSLEKGIFLYGQFGVGKTWLMKLFAKNQRQVYHTVNAITIADNFQKDGIEGIEVYTDKVKNAFNDVSCFYQRESGLLIDDIGTEDPKKHFGNNRNVIGDLIEIRYSKQNCGLFLHGTTNLSANQIKEYYGGRVASRMREIFNIIDLKGADRRR